MVVPEAGEKKAQQEWSELLSLFWWIWGLTWVQSMALQQSFSSDWAVCLTENIDHKRKIQCVETSTPWHSLTQNEEFLQL